MADQPLSPETPDEDLPQDPGIPGGPLTPDEDEDEDEQDSLERPSSPDDPRGIDAPGSPHVAPPQH
jgi:hypothetical protein